MQRISRALQRVQALPRNTLKGASIAAARGFSSDIKRDGESITVEVGNVQPAGGLSRLEAAREEGVEARVCVILLVEL